MSALSLAVLAGAVVGWQVRAAQAQERLEQSSSATGEVAQDASESAQATPAAPTPTPERTPSPSPTAELVPDAATSSLPAAAASPAPAAVDPAPTAVRPAGAGPDCGGPGSYEPPVQDGRPIFYTSTPSASGDGSNGRVPASAMAPLGWCEDSQGNKQWLRADAAAALTRLNEAFRAEFDENIAVDLSYRSYEQQVAMRSYYGTLAARPGTSNHGLGTAIDTWEWAAYSFGSPRYDWLVLHAPEYGWVAPSWARAGGSNPEYWHFEFTG